MNQQRSRRFRKARDDQEVGCSVGAHMQNIACQNSCCFDPLLISVSCPVTETLCGLLRARPAAAFTSATVCSQQQPHLKHPFQHQA